MHRLIVALLMAAAPGAAENPSDLGRVSIGNRPPDFDLPAAGGGRVTLDSLRGKPTVLVFYRGYW